MAANKADFEGVTYSLKKAPEDTEDIKWNWTHEISAHHPNESLPIGRLLLNNEEVKYVTVDRQHRRKGIATGMVNFAKANGLEIKAPGLRTDAGDAFAKSLGVELPERTNTQYLTDL
jgi:GNAT superfamily N-acetyltransferase